MIVFRAGQNDIIREQRDQAGDEQILQVCGIFGGFSGSCDLVSFNISRHKHPKVAGWQHQTFSGNWS